MRRYWMAAAALQLFALPALAQTAPTSPTARDVPAVTMPSTPPVASTMPKAGSDSLAGTTMGGERGANSFTEGQARSRLEKEGYNNVSGLTKDSDGIWRGRATKGSAEQGVGVDYKGNIVVR
jgi:protein CpxP